MSFVHGGVTYPLASSTSNTLLRDSDPQLFYALDFFSAMITEYVGARLVAQAALTNAKITQAVAMTVPYDPLPYLTQDQFQFPLFALYRKNEQLSQRSTAWRHNSCDWACAYVLPTLTPGQMEQLYPIMKSIGRVLDNRAHAGLDASYTPPGGSLGGSVWALAGLEKVDFLGATYVPMPGKMNLVFPCWLGEFRDVSTTDTVLGKY